MLKARDLMLIAANALGIGAASFASVWGQQTTDNRQRNFLSEEKTKSEQRYSGKPDGDSRNAQMLIFR